MYIQGFFSYIEQNWEFLKLHFPGVTTPLSLELLSFESSENWVKAVYLRLRCHPKGLHVADN